MTRPKSADAQKTVRVIPTAKTHENAGDAGAVPRLLERIEQRHSGILKVADVASCDRQVMLQCGRCDQTVFHGHGFSLFFEANEQSSPD